MTEKTPLSYRDAGVDIDAGNALVDDIKQIVKPTMRPEVMGGIGGFGSLVRIPEGYRKPVLVSGTDGVGTKLKLALATRRFDGLGIDLVAMCVNDILVTGAEPLFFLDYYATGKLDNAVARQIIRGIADGCQQAGCALVGGETAEMPGVYSGGDFDVAGFCVGVAEEDQLIDGSSVTAGDVLIGLPASGAHSNGYSLIRKVIETSGVDLDAALPGDADGRSYAEALMAPTRIYVACVRELLKQLPIKAMAHITGGGLPENLPRVLPQGCGATVQRGSWQRPALFDWLQAAGGIAQSEMDRTFNCGVGFVLVVAADQAQRALAELRAQGEQPWLLGEISRDAEHRVRYL